MGSKPLLSELAILRLSDSYSRLDGHEEVAATLVNCGGVGTFSSIRFGITNPVQSYQN